MKSYTFKQNIILRLFFLLQAIVQVFDGIVTILTLTFVRKGFHIDVCEIQLR